jgi:hypothetical protein
VQINYQGDFMKIVGLFGLLFILLATQTQTFATPDGTAPGDPIKFDIFHRGAIYIDPIRHPVSYKTLDVPGKADRLYDWLRTKYIHFNCTQAQESTIIAQQSGSHELPLMYLTTAYICEDQSFVDKAEKAKAEQQQLDQPYIPPAHLR